MAVDNATVNLYVNNEQAKGAIAQLTKEYQDLKKARKEADAAGDINKSLQLQAQERTALEKLKEAKRGVLDIEKAMANLSVLNLRQLASIRGKLKRELLDLNQGTEDYLKKQAQLTKVEEQLASAQGRRTSGQMSFFKKIVATGVFAFLANGLKSIFKNAIDVRKEFEKYEAVLKNTLQSEVQMVQAMNMLKEVAKGTPFQLNELVAGFVKLVNQGFQPTKDEIIKMGDLASSTGKSFDQLVEAILDAQTGQFERLKEFGIKASKNGDMVKFTFKGVTTEIKNSSTAIQDYILGLGEMEGVLGSMASISETTEGKISNMGDAWDSLMNTMGSRTGGVVSYVLDALIDLIDMLEIASMSIDQIKAKARDEQDSTNLKLGIDAVESSKKNKLERGEFETEKEATENALSHYKKWKQVAIDRYKEQIKSASGSYAAWLNKEMTQEERELELVVAHYAKLENKLKLENKQKGTNTSGGDKNKKSWSLDDDETFAAERLKLRQKLFDDEIKTEEEHSALLLSLEIKTLEARIASKKESGKDLVKLQQSLFDKQYSQQKNEQTRLDKLLSASLEGASDTDTEQLIAAEKNGYEKRLKDLGLFYKKGEDLTAEEKAALLNQERLYTAKVQKIQMDRIKREFDEKNAEVNRAITQLKIKHNNELSEADSFVKKKVLLSKWMSSEELRQIKTSRQADKALKDHYNFLEQQDAEKQFKALLDTYNKYMEEMRNITQDGNPKFSDQEIKRLLEIIDILEKKLAELNGANSDSDDKADVESGDILGFSADKWETFFERMDAGTMKLNDWQMALQLVGDAFGEISKLMSAAEQREFKEYEKTANNKKKTLDQQLKKGVLSQESYNKKIQAIDDETDQRRTEMERKQAVREKAMAIFQALVNTAVGVTSALTIPPPAGPILAGIVAGLGAVQIAAIAATPLPGAEEGGYLKVKRAQDGKEFNAKYDPSRRGYFDKTSVIVNENENEPEYVASGKAVKNPTIRPVLDIIDIATRNGTVGSINLPEVIATTMQGRSNGGYFGVSQTATPEGNAPQGTSLSSEDIQVLFALKVSIDKLNEKLDKPFPVNFYMGGADGFHEKYTKYKRTFETNRL